MVVLMSGCKEVDSSTLPDRESQEPAAGHKQVLLIRGTRGLGGFTIEERQVVCLVVGPRRKGVPPRTDLSSFLHFRESGQFTGKQYEALLTWAAKYKDALFSLQSTYGETNRYSPRFVLRIGDKEHRVIYAKKNCPAVLRKAKSELDRLLGAVEYRFLDGHRDYYREVKRILETPAR